jgi:hypothetical protein
MIVMITLAGSILVAEAWRLCVETRQRRGVILAIALAVVVILQSVPARLPATRVALPAVVTFLRDQHGSGGYLDATVEPLLDLQNSDLRPMAYQMYFQTVHEKPIAYGYTARNTIGSIEHDRELQRLASIGDVLSLRCQFNVRWLLSERVMTQQGVRRVQLAHPAGGESPPALYELSSPCAVGER